MTNSNDDEACDVQFSMRVPKSLADEIFARAEREGMKPSTWIRNAISKTIADKDTAGADDIRSSLILLLNNDQTVRDIIRKIRGETDQEEELEILNTEISNTEEKISLLEIESNHMKQCLKDLEIDYSVIMEKTKALQYALESDESRLPQLMAILDEYKTRSWEIKQRIDDTKTVIDSMNIEISNSKEIHEIMKKKYADMSRKCKVRRNDDF